MSNFTKKEINDYADKLLIGLTEEEETMIQSEFDEIEKNMDLINEIPNIKDIEPLSFPFETYIDDLRSDSDEEEGLPIETLLQNCDQFEGREVEVPKVMG